MQLRHPKGVLNERKEFVTSQREPAQQFVIIIIITSGLCLLRYAQCGHLVSALGPSALGLANHKLRF